MSAYKDKKTGKWYVFFYYRDWQGENKGKTKRGFATKRDALEWEREFLQKSSANLDMSFSAFVEIYTNDLKSRLKQNTWMTKQNIIEQKILPYFKDKKINEIKPADVIAWQNEIMKICDKNGKVYSPTYLKTIHNQLSAIFNHAVRFYELKSNPARKAGNMGKEKTKEMLFWTKEEYLKFSDSMMDKPISFYAFEILYWCGIRLGELLALTQEDFDFNKSTVRINKSYQRINCTDVVTEPKTPKSVRIIKMPDFLTEEVKEYIKSIYGIKLKDRLFPITKSYLHHEMNRGSKEQGIKRIRVHDLRHSHVSLLIEMGFSAVAIADRVGHENIDITYRYAHLFPSKQVEIADKLSIERGNDNEKNVRS
ncbi:site-specific integrase [Oceanirhabdus seepicola]|uniref:Site-specific integrase n=1 Tax=Oceanirhabdus seepicola TaxID=2828781 RepID=A0A9J6P0U5_9CLOT|nr:site-specific integrase [Oceanirhabdus seepicola]MCM1990163.1 site-specific integrase [Oceanirhabdus seepicola]